jgi:hypothetical protein
VTGQRRRESLRGWFTAGVWLIAVIACPLALSILASVYPTPTVPQSADPRIAFVINCLGWGQVVVTVLAAVAAYRLTRDWHLRLMGWIVVAFVLGVTFLAAVAAGIAVTGVNL